MYPTGIMLHIETLEHDQLIEEHIATIKDVVKKLTCAKSRMFQVQVAIDDVNSKTVFGRKTFGWDRKTVVPGLNELCARIICVDNYNPRIEFQLVSVC